MNQRQKIVQQQFLNNEEAVIKRLKQVYSQSLSDIEKKAKALQDDINRLDAMANLATDAEEKAQILSMQQSKVYQKQYQDALKKQIGSILDNMQVEEFKVVSDYLQKCYEEAYIGTMYDLQGQGIPLCVPLDQEAMVRAVQLDSPIREGMYAHFGENVKKLKRDITAQVSRGISTGMSWQQVAKQLSGKMIGTYNNPGGSLYYAMRIARTEGHRIQVQGTMDACYKAKEKGADVVKQWDATLDSRTRDSHVAVDGEIRELDEKFSNGLMFPGDPAGGAAEVCNCRCALLQRARWALDEDELKVLEERAAFFGLDKADTFDDYKKKYLQAAREESKHQYDSAVINPLVKKSEYRNLYNNLDESVEIQRTACERSRAMLEHRNGTHYEDLTYIDTATGKHLTRTDYNVENEVLPSKRMMSMVRKSEPYTIIAIHNHAGNAVPSIVDIETAFTQKYKYGLIACHNGNVIKYEVTGEINSVNVDIFLDKANRILYNTKGFRPDKWQEVLEQLESENVRMKVFTL